MQYDVEKRRKGPRQVLDVLQIGAAQVLLETQDALDFSIPQHCYEYLNTLGWFYDNFEHPQRLKLLYVEGRRGSPPSSVRGGATACWQIAAAAGGTTQGG
jgi:hypothetical protein